MRLDYMRDFFPVPHSGEQRMGFGSVAIPGPLEHDRDDAVFHELQGEIEVVIHHQGNPQIFADLGFRNGGFETVVRKEDRLERFREMFFDPCFGRGAVAIFVPSGNGNEFEPLLFESSKLLLRSLDRRYVMVMSVHIFPPKNGRRLQIEIELRDFTYFMVGEIVPGKGDGKFFRKKSGKASVARRYGFVDVDTDFWFFHGFLSILNFN